MAGKVVDLVLQGGGVKGIALVGAISVLEQHGVSFPRVAGASAGAIVGSLVAAGMSAGQLREVVQTLDYRAFRDETGWDKVPVVGKPISFVRDHGLYAGNYFRDWIAQQLQLLGKGDLRRSPR